MSNPSSYSEPAAALAAYPAEWASSASALPYGTPTARHQPEVGSSDPLAAIGHIGRYAIKLKIRDGIPRMSNSKTPGANFAWFVAVSSAATWRQ